MGVGLVLILAGSALATRGGRAGPAERSVPAPARVPGPAPEVPAP